MGAFKVAASGEMTIQLVEDGPPIEGRIVDLDGRPVAGARVQATRLFFAARGELTPWLTQARDRVVRGLNELPMTVATTTTGPDGQFRITGIGRDRVAELTISGPTIATTEVMVVNRDGAEFRRRDESGMPGRFSVIHPRRFAYAVAPTKPVEGVVRDRETGRPIAGLTLHAAVDGAATLAPTGGTIEAVTDDQGRYRLIGLPKAPRINWPSGRPRGSLTRGRPSGSGNLARLRARHVRRRR